MASFVRRENVHATGTLSSILRIEGRRSAHRLRRKKRETYKLGKVELPGEMRKILGNKSREDEHVVRLLEGEATLPPLRSQLVGRLERDADVCPAISRLRGYADPVFGEPSVDEGDGGRG